MTDQPKIIPCVAGPMNGRQIDEREDGPIGYQRVEVYGKSFCLHESLIGADQDTLVDACFWAMQVHKEAPSQSLR